MICHKCNGTGWYVYDQDHAQVCGQCCTHDQGRFQLIDHHGKNNGKWCCRNGCGKLWDTKE